jgi:hypothetical protein
MVTIPRTPVVSSNVVSVGYDPATLTLVVEFRGGSVYAYAGVPEIVHGELMKAPSVGSFFATRIRPHFEATKVPSVPAEGGDHGSRS